MASASSATEGTSGDQSDDKENMDLHKFLQLVRDGDEAKVDEQKNTEIIQSDLNKRDANKLTALQYAVICNRPRVLETLLFKFEGADINVTDSNGLSLAHHAAKITRQHQDVRGHAGRSPGVSIDGSEQPRAAVDENEEKNCLSVLISSKKTLMRTTDKDGQTPMHYAVMSGNLEAVKLLHKEDDTKNRDDKLIYKGDDSNMTPLHVAASYGQYHIAKYLLENDAEYLKRDKDRNTPLHYACAAGNMEMTELLLGKASADKLEKLVDAEDNAGNTCLHLAAENGHVNIVQALIEKDAGVMVTRKDGMYPLHLAITAGKLDIVMKLSTKMENVSKGNNAEKRENFYGSPYSIMNMAESTPLHIAAEYNRLDIAEYILKKHIEVLHKRDKDGNTPLHKSAFSGNAGMVKLLMNKGADTRDKNIQGRIALHLAAERGQVEAFEALLFPTGVTGGSNLLKMDDAKRRKIEDKLKLLSKTDDQSTRDTLIETVAKELKGDLPGVIQDNKVRHIVKAVVLAQTWSKGNSAESAEKGGSNQRKQSPASTNVATSFGESMEKLPRVLHAHTMINAEDQDVNTPLHLAARGGHVVLVERILKDYFVEPNRKNDDERTPLHMAALHGKTRTAEMIISVSPNAVFAEDQKGNTPLHLAAQSGHKNMLELLMKYKADIHHKNVSGRTALDLAATTGWEEVCSLLVKVEAQSGLRYKEPDDKSPLYLACEHGHLRVAKLMLKNNSDVTAKSRDWNCLDVAVENGHRDIALLIIRSGQWRAALQNRSRPLDKPDDWDEERNRIDTPMRRLIRKLPDVAWEVMDKCRYQLGKKTKYDYQFIDDLYEDWTLADIERNEQIAARQATEREKNKEMPWKCLKSYTDKARTIKKNHPLMIMVKCDRDELLQHPMVIKLIKQKWFKFAVYYYLITLLVHLLFLVLLTRAIIQNKPPHEYTELEVLQIKEGTCDALIDGTFLSYWLPTEKFILYGLIIVGAIFEFTQIYTARSAYFASLESYVEWVVYVLSFLYLLDFNGCTLRTGYREHWQWSLGAFAVFFSWVDMVLYLKAFTSLGLYVIMFQLVCWTFLQVFVVFFSLIGAFALGFHILLQNQIPFRDVANSILRSSVMFLGEIDYNEMFNSGVNESGTDQNLLYPAATSVMFSSFLLLACIVLMNLLVGLAVDDIKGITRKAAFRRTSMHVELVLDVEKLLFEKWRKSVYRARKKAEHIDKQQKQHHQNTQKESKCCWNPWKWFKNLGIWWWNHTLEQDETVILKQIPELTKRQEELHRSIEQMNKQMVVLNRRVMNVLLKLSHSDAGFMEDGLEEDEVSRDDIFTQQ